MSLIFQNTRRTRFPSALGPYTSSRPNWIVRIAAFFALLAFCFLYGFAFSLFAPYLILPFAVPLLVLASLVVWVLPDSRTAPTNILTMLFYVYFVSLAVWPNYLAIALPGLPWITTARLTSFPDALVLLVCISISSEFREKLKGSLSAIPSIPILLSIFVVIQLTSIGLSRDISLSVDRFVVAQTTWTAMFFVSAYIFVRPGRAEKWAIALWVTAVFVSLITIWEFRLKHLPWAGHIPSFLKISDPTVATILFGDTARAGTDRYRAKATFSTSLGLAEYIAISFPFVLHFASANYGRWTRGAAIASVPLLLGAVFLSDSKLGVIGCLIAILLYVLMTSIRHWNRNKTSIFAPAVVISYPVVFCTVVGAIFTWRRLGNLVLGGGEHASSTNSRIVQYTMGIPKILAWPFGYGIGTGAETLGYRIGEGLTIDSYYLSIALEYGVIGFLVYYGMLVIAIFEAGTRGFRGVSTNREEALFIPIAISLTAFVVVKSVFSQQDNHPIIFMILGMLVALAFRSDTKSVLDKSRT